MLFLPTLPGMGASEQDGHTSAAPRAQAGGITLTKSGVNAIVATRATRVQRVRDVTNHQAWREGLWQRRKPSRSWRHGARSVGGAIGPCVARAAAHVHQLAAPRARAGQPARAHGGSHSGPPALAPPPARDSRSCAHRMFGSSPVWQTANDEIDSYVLFRDRQ